MKEVNERGDERKGRKKDGIRKGDGIRTTILLIKHTECALSYLPYYLNRSELTNTHQSHFRHTLYFFSSICCDSSPAGFTCGLFDCREVGVQGKS